MRYLLLTLTLLLLSGCDNSERPLDEIVGSSLINQSWTGTVVDRNDQTIIWAGQSRYIILHFNGIEVGSIRGAHFKSIESICEVYCN